MLSPFMFVLYIGGLVDQMKEAGCQGVYVNEWAPNVSMLMYDDDIAVCADTKVRLQEKIDTVVDFCKKWGLKANLLKTKIMVFRRGGIIKTFEKWNYAGVPIEIINRYKYLGDFFTVKLNWSLCKNTVAQQAKKALNLVNMYTYKCGGNPTRGDWEISTGGTLPHSMHKILVEDYAIKSLNISKCLL